ncbi:MAG: hypothetical protein J6Y43_04130, partial [Clostridia bacterium]|nr:hypothetical protein [Clostridia bacterium]
MKKLLVVMMAITALLCLTFAACGEIKDNGKEGGGEQTPATYTVTVSVSDAAYGTVSKTSIENVEKGTAVAVNGNVLTVGEETVTATATANTAEFTYAFTGFTGTAATVTGNIEITANFSRTVNKYTITFEMGDGVAIDPIEEDYGTSVTELNNISVTGPAGYDFVKWQLKDGNDYVDFAGDETLEGDITVKAVYVVETYTVSVAINNAEYGTVSAASVMDVPYGTAITVDGATLTIGETVITATATVRDAQYTYAFTGFTGTAATVTGNMEFTANFTRVINQYVIVIDMDGGILSDGVNDDITSLTVDYGTDLSELDSLTKTRLGYTFEKWQYFNGENYVDLPAQMTVEFGFSIKAAWSVNTYTVSIAVNNADYGTVDVASVANVPYGTAITVEGNVITVGTTAITATKNNDDAQYTYEFAGFTGTVDTVTGNVEITANFTRETKTYTVSITVDNAEYGTVSTASVAVSYGTAISVEGNVITIGETE